MTGKFFLRKKKLFQKIMIILFWLCVWQIVAVFTHNSILLVGPLQVGRTFLINIAREDFIRIILYSFGRIGLGFFAAFFCALFLGALSYRYALAEMFLAPLITMLKSIPVASFVVLLLIWFGSSNLSFFISFLIVFPNVYVNTIAGLKSTDRQLLEMAQVFDISGRNLFYYLYRPALMPYLLSCLRISLGMSWKSGVAAEVIGMPSYSLGERLYMSKIYLDTAGLFAWTLTVILLSFLFEKAVLYLGRRYAGWKPRPRLGRQKNVKTEEAEKAALHINGIDKSYGTQKVFKNFSLTMEYGGHYCLMAPSGSGKTTLLRILNELEQADDGVIEGMPEHVGMVFQEDRLCEEYDVISNIMLTIRRREKGMTALQIKEEALKLLPEECLTKPVSELSGGMRRRCAILRAMLSDSDIIMMDEPFTGLDEENHRKTAAYILERLQGRTLLVATHRAEDVELLQAVRVEV